MSLWALVLVACVGRQPVPAAAAAVSPAAASGDASTPVARGHYLAAVWHWELGECDAAEQAFAKALLFDPGSPWLWQDQGRARLDCGDAAGGEALLRQAGEAGAGSAWGHLAESVAAAGREMDAHDAVRAWAQAEVPVAELAWRGRWRVAAGDLPGGLGDLVAGLPERPDDLAGMGAMLDAASRLRRLETARVVLVRVQGLNPRERQLLRWLGDLAAELGDDTVALASYLSLDRLTGGTSAEVWTDLARVALRSRDAGLASQLLARGSADAGLTAGLLGLAGRLTEAEALLDEAQAAAPLDRGLALRRAEVRASAGDLAGALAAVAAIEGLAPEATARLQARYLAQAGQLVEAEVLLAPHGDQRAAVRMRVRLLLDLERSDDALALAAEGLARWPGDPVLAERRVLALEALERVDEAVAAASSVVLSDPGAVDAVLVLARLQPVSAELQLALWACIEANPGEPELWLELARARALGGLADGARAAAKRAEELGG